MLAQIDWHPYERPTGALPVDKKNPAAYCRRRVSTVGAQQQSWSWLEAGSYGVDQNDPSVLVFYGGLSNVSVMTFYTDTPNEIANAIVCPTNSRSARTPPSATEDLQVTVTCLAGNGRIEINVVNEGDAAFYELQVGELAPRRATVESQSWWRSPVTGRPEGPIDVTLKRDGVVVVETTVNVACDSDQVVSAREVDVMTWCIGSRGMIWAQMVNSTDAPRSYIFQVATIRKSTTAAAFGAALRGVSGRPNGTYNVQVSVAGEVIHAESVQVDCSSQS